MKRLILLVLAIVVFATVLSGCGGSKVKCSAKAISVGKQAISVVDDYLDGNISYYTADSKLDELYDDMEYANDLPYDDEYRTADLFVRWDISLCESDLVLDWVKCTSESYNNLIDSRNKLAEEIGEKKR